MRALLLRLWPDNRSSAERQTVFRDAALLDQLKRAKSFRLHSCPQIICAPMLASFSMPCGQVIHHRKTKQVPVLTRDALQPVDELVAGSQETVLSRCRCIPEPGDAAVGAKVVETVEHFGCLRPDGSADVGTRRGKRPLSREYNAFGD